MRKTLEAKHARVWGDILDGEGKGPDYKVTENMYIEKIFHVLSKEGAEAMVRKEWNNSFTYMDVNQDGAISREEHRRFFEARKHIDPNGAIVAFSAIDKNRVGFITREEYVEAAMEYFFNFSDETKPSKHFFGPLVKINFIKFRLYSYNDSYSVNLASWLSIDLQLISGSYK